jgi:uncharacterized membrane protein (UPF0127 family)
MPAAIVAAALTATGMASAHPRRRDGRPATVFPARRVTIGGVSGCWPVAVTLRQREQGLMGVARPVRPMVFSFRPAGLYGFWMQHTPARLIGVWIGEASTVIGFWTGAPESLVLQFPPQPVSAVIEYPAGWTVPRRGAKLTLGGPCRSDGRL